MRESDHLKSLRLPDAGQAEVARRLDRAGAESRNSRRRLTPRLPYQRPDVAVTITHPAGGTCRFSVFCRNLSAGGMSFLLGGFLHNGSEVRATLPKLKGGAITIFGKVVNCRHIAANIHEVGVAFFDKIDVLEFADPGDVPVTDDGSASLDAPEIAGEVLCCVESKPEARLLALHLSGAGANPTMVETLGAAFDAVKRQAFDLIIVDLDNQDGVAAPEAFRSGAWRGPIVALTAEASPPPGDMVDAVIIKPYDVAEMLRVLARHLENASASGQPIFSELASQAGMPELIEQYLADLRSTVRQVRQAIEKNDAAALRALCQSVKSTAGGYGFPQLSEAARLVVRSLDAKSGIADAAQEARRIELLVSRMQARRKNKA